MASCCPRRVTAWPAMVGAKEVWFCARVARHFRKSMKYGMMMMMMNIIIINNYYYYDIYYTIITMMMMRRRRTMMTATFVFIIFVSWTCRWDLRTCKIYSNTRHSKQATKSQNHKKQTKYICWQQTCWEMLIIEPQATKPMAKLWVHFYPLPHWNGLVAWHGSNLPHPNHGWPFSYWTPTCNDWGSTMT